MTRDCFKTNPMISVQSLLIIILLSLFSLPRPVKSNIDNDDNKRLVILAGPHKSASSATQEFFLQYASGRPKYRKMKAFQNWRWPVVQENDIPAAFSVSNVSDNFDTNNNDKNNNNNNNNDNKYNNNPHSFHMAQRKLFSELVLKADNPSVQAKITTAILRQWHRDNTTNVILGSEEFDRFGLTPWSNRDGIAAISKIIKFVQPKTLDIVVNYRTPRFEHWLSIWKQLYYKQDGDNSTYADFMCFPGKRKWEYLNSVSNPLGLVQALRANNWNVTLIDMGGVAKKQLDISHVIACQVLQVPCSKDYWVRGVNRTIVSNVKTRQHNLPPSIIEDMEWLFRKRDCSFAKQLQNDPGVRIILQDSLWQDCIAHKPNSGETIALYDKLNQTDFLLRLLQNQMECKFRGVSINTAQWIQAVSAPLIMEEPPNTILDFASTQQADMMTTVGDLEFLRKFQRQLSMIIISLIIAVYSRRYCLGRRSKISSSSSTPKTSNQRQQAQAVTKRNSN